MLFYVLYKKSLIFIFNVCILHENMLIATHFIHEKGHQQTEILAILYWLR